MYTINAKNIEAKKKRTYKKQHLSLSLYFVLDHSIKSIKDIK